MAFPITGAAATITSVTSSDLSQLLITALRQTQVTVNITASQEDVTALGGSATGVEYLIGLQEGTLSFTGRYPRTSPDIGNGGLVTGLAASMAWMKAWTLNIDFGEEDITSFNATPVTAKRFMPGGIYNWGGSFTCVHLESAAASLPDAVNALAGTSCQFKLAEDGANDPQLSGNVLLTGQNSTITPGGQQLLEYSYVGTGTLSEIGGSTLPRLLTTGSAGATVAIARPTWDSSGSNGVPDISLVLTRATSRTVTANGFLSSLSLSYAPGSPIDVSGTVRFSDGITVA